MQSVNKCFDRLRARVSARLAQWLPRRFSRVRWGRVLLALLCLALAVFGTTRLIGYLADSAAARRANEAVRALYAANDLPETPKMPETPDLSAITDPSDQPAPAPTARPTLKGEYQYIGVSVLTEIRRLMNKNADTAAWLNVPGVVDLPVMYRDNTYYLTHDFYGNKGKAGALFLDQAHPIAARTQHLVIHGHNMKNGDMFGLLTHYLKLDYIKEHALVFLTTRYRAETYAVFAVAVVSGDVRAPGYIGYLGTPTFGSEARFSAFVDQLRENSICRIPLDVTPADALLTLSTCYDEDYLLIVCRRLRDGETEVTIGEALAQSSLK